MTIINMVNNIKDLFGEYVIFIKIGNFYQCYNNDACIIAYLFGYKIKTMASNDLVCEFPTVSLNQVISNPENRNIKYKINR